MVGCDATGIRLILTALRDATRKEAGEERDRPRGDPMAPRKDRTYDHRRAVVIAVWDQPLEVPTAEQIIDILRPAAERRLDRLAPLAASTSAADHAGRMIRLGVPRLSSIRPCSKNHHGVP